MCLKYRIVVLIMIIFQTGSNIIIVYFKHITDIVVIITHYKRIGYVIIPKPHFSGSEGICILWLSLSQFVAFSPFWLNMLPL